MTTEFPKHVENKIQQIASEFKTRWNSEEKVNFNSFLEQIDARYRNRLLRVLIELDIANRKSSAKAVNPSDYAHLSNDADTIAGDLLTSFQGQHPPTGQFGSRYKTGQEIGAYKLVEQIGEGGMGAVWLADQQKPVRRRVAIKLIKSDVSSADTIARFQAERQALAMMNHPNIAKVLDAGTTENGNPYFVMEFVDGIRITDYCDNNQLSVRDRLQLFVPVCMAIQHAHQKAIIHRDLKPSNILVTVADGKAVPKVIDFGLAKALEKSTRLTEQTMHTQVGEVMGTLRYMSPEQAEIDSMDIDARSDIYSLGVVLYELLAGSTPLENQTISQYSLVDLLQIIRRKEPPKPSIRLGDSRSSIDDLCRLRRITPSRLRQVLRGELDWVIMKTLELDRSRRYETASEFAADIERFLNGEAVIARPPSWSYQARKFVTKHKVPVMAATLLLLTLIAGIVGTSWGLIRAESARQDAVNAREDESKQKELAEERRKEAEREKEESDRQRQRAERREETAINAMKQFGDAVANSSELKNSAALVELRKTFLQEPIEFFQALKRQLQADKNTSDQSLVRLGNAMYELGELTSEIDDKQNALLAYQEALAIFQQLSDARPGDSKYRSLLGNAIFRMANALAATGRLQEAFESYEKAIDLLGGLAKEFPDDPGYRADLANCHNNIGLLHRDRGNSSEALQSHEAAIAIQLELVQSAGDVEEFRSDLATSYGNKGIVLQTTGEHSNAMEAYQQAMDIRRALTEAYPGVADYQADLANSYINIGVAQKANGLNGEALNSFEAAIEIQQQLVEANPTNTSNAADLGTSYINLGVQLRTLGRQDDALEAYDNAIELQTQLTKTSPTVPDYKSNLALSYNNKGSLLLAVGKTGPALEAYKKAIDLNQELVDNHADIAVHRSNLATSHENIGRLNSSLGQTETAVDSHRRALEIRQKLVHDYPEIDEYQASLAGSFNNVGVQLKVIGEPGETLKHWRRANELLQRLADKNQNVDQYRSDLAGSFSNIGVLLHDMGQANEALDAWDRAIDLQQELADADPNVVAYQANLANTYTNVGVVLHELGNAQAALDAWTKGQVTLQSVVENNPTLSEYKADLALSQCNTGVLLSSIERVDEAIESFKKAIAIQKQLVKAHPEVARYKSELATSYKNVGGTYYQLQDFESAVDAFRAGKEIREELVDSDPKNVSYQSELAQTFNNLAIIQMASGDALGASRDAEQAIKLQRPVFESYPELTQSRLYLAKHYRNLIDALALSGQDEKLFAAKKKLAELNSSDPEYRELDQLMEKVITGQHEPSVDEKLKLATRCLDTARYARCADFYEQLIDENDLEANSMLVRYFDVASSAASMAAAGYGSGAPQVGSEDSNRLHELAIRWVTTRLQAFEKEVAESAQSNERKAIADVLYYLKTDHHFFHVRGKQQLGKLRENQKKQWNEIWNRVDQLIEACEKQPATNDK